MKNDSIKSKRREVERNVALRVYIMWAWIEEQEIKALKEDTYIDREKIKWEYPLYTELRYHNMEGECPWCHIFSVYIPQETEYQEGYDRCQTKCSGCPLNLAGNCCDGPDDVLWRKWRFGEGIGNKHALCAGEIASLAWRIYKGLGG